MTAANGLLRANAVGGGTWITEFETIVGLDFPLFGYSGMHTHPSLSPFVNRSIATYMRDLGYHSWAFFPHRGNFYNARNAYANCGCEKTVDSEYLGQGGWLKNDFAVAGSVAATIGPQPDLPFFGCVLLLENHVPNEYLRRFGSTAAAVRSLVAFLAEIESRTGRPFVLLVFGDRQPHAFFHFIATVRGRTLRCCSAVPSAAVLPTLLSGFVARSADDVYLGTNLWLHARCGPDAVQVDFGNFMERLQSRSVHARTEECRQVHDRALSGYRSSGVVRLVGDGGYNGRLSQAGAER